MPSPPAARAADDRGGYLLATDGTRLLGGGGGRGYSRPPSERLEPAAGVKAGGDLVSGTTGVQHSLLKTLTTGFRVPIARQKPVASSQCLTTPGQSARAQPSMSPEKG